MGCLGRLLSRFEALLGRLGALLGRLHALLGASWAVLGRSWGPLEPSWSVGEPKTRESPNPSKTVEKAMIFASRRALGRPLGGFLGRLGGLLDRLGAILGVLERFVGVLGAWWGAPRRSPSRLGRCSRPGGHATNPRSARPRPGIRGSGPLRNYNPSCSSSTELQQQQRS